MSVCAALLSQKRPAGLRDVFYTGSTKRVARVAELPSLPGPKAAIELKGGASLEAFLDMTAKCGLAEPQLLVRPIHTLSSGQQYRLRVALAFLSRPEVVLIDNFCEPLDQYTSVAVMRGIKRLAEETGAAVLGATATYERFRSFGLIDQKILLRRGDDPIIKRKRLP